MGIFSKPEVIILKEFSDAQKYLEKLENESKDKMICPSCGSDLILRTAKKGMNVGQQFYGCTNYPRCRFILNLCNKEQ